MLQFPLLRRSSMTTEEDESRNTYTQADLPFEVKFWIAQRKAQIESEQQKDHDVEQIFPGLREHFDGIFAVQYYLFAHEKLQRQTYEFPISAVVAQIQNGRMTAGVIETNRTNTYRNSIAHAELVAIDSCLKRDGNKHIPENSILLCPIEPCAMCAGAFYNAGGTVIIYSLSQQEFMQSTFYINGEIKPFRVEPPNYSAKEFMHARNPKSIVIGGYRKFDAFEFYSGIYTYEIE